MKSQRKYIRIALTNDDMILFIAAKKRAEESANIKMRDSMFALSVIRKAIAKSDGSA